MMYALMNLDIWSILIKVWKMFCLKSGLFGIMKSGKIGERTYNIYR